jgi:hypothetical protein
MTKQTLWKSLKLQEGKIVSDYDKSPWTVREWRNNPYPVKGACSGLNCCPHAADAMGYVMCEVLAQVEIRGKQIEEDDKITAQEMCIVSAWKWTPKDSAELAIYAAELVSGIYERKYPSDPRVREAITKAKEGVAATGAYAAALAADAAYAAALAAYAADEREKLKIKIDRWIINHLETCEKLEV